MRIVFVGPPGSGKGTQAALLQERPGVPVIGTGDLLRAAVRDDTPTGRKAKSYMAQGHLVPDELVNQIVSEYFHRPDPPRRFVLDGYPRNEAQADFLDDALADCKLPLTRVVLFSVPEDELVRRLSARKIAENRVDDDEATIRKRLELYNSETKPIVEHYRRLGLLSEIPATGTVEDIHRKVLATIA
jgi:adenylate kinase